MNPESLHEKNKGTDSRTDAQFVNPGTSPSSFVKMEERKHAKISNANSAALVEKASNPNNV